MPRPIFHALTPPMPMGIPRGPYKLVGRPGRELGTQIARQEGEIPRLHLAMIPFDNSLRPGWKGPGGSDLIEMEGRKMVIAQDDRLKLPVPFYLSTGQGGKANVPEGHWYPFMGVSPDQQTDQGFLPMWINKTTEEEIAQYYRSPHLRRMGQSLDRYLGDIRDLDEGIPYLYGSDKSAIEAINAPIIQYGKHAPVPNGRGLSQRVFENANAIRERLETRYQIANFNDEIQLIQGLRDQGMDAATLQGRVKGLRDRYYEFGKFNDQSWNELLERKGVADLL